MSFSHDDHLVNLELLKIARQNMGGFGNLNKQAFIPGGDMSGGGAPPGGDPAAGGGAPPGGDPAAGGGGGGGGGDPTAALQPMIQQMVQQAMMQQGGGMGGGMGGAGAAGGKNALTPKIDEKAVMLQMLKILARIADHLKIPIPASEMVVNQNDMQGLAQASSSGGPLPGIDPTAGGGAGGGGGGAIPPMGGMDGMQPAGQPGMGDPTKQGSFKGNGIAFDSAGLTEVSNKAAAIARFRKQAASAR